VKRKLAKLAAESKMREQNKWLAAAKGNTWPEEKRKLQLCVCAVMQPAPQ